MAKVIGAESCHRVEGAAKRGHRAPIPQGGSLPHTRLVPGMAHSAGARGTR